MPTQRDQPDYYSLLGVPIDASPAAIKAAFKRLALRYHPDVYHGADAEERMRQLLLAYHTLCDPAKRQAYDAHRPKTRTGQESRTQHTAQPPAGNRTPSVVSPSARRDRHRPYAFPNLQADAPARFHLGEISYDLSPEETNTLMQQGYLRGIAQEAASTLPLEVRESLPHFCHRCHHRWVPAEMDPGPARLWMLICPACKANDWGEYLLLRCIHCQAIFESEQIRDQIGAASGQLCPPYALFPLCPYCGAARWCPAEESRLAASRSRAARKRQRFWPRS